MEFAIGVLVGVTAMASIGYLLIRREWAERQRLSRHVSRLHAHLSCGAGFLGCKGGPQCQSDRK